MIQFCVTMILPEFTVIRGVDLSKARPAEPLGDVDYPQIKIRSKKCTEDYCVCQDKEFYIRVYIDTQWILNTE